ncbi:hypothetical protein [Arthrobacter sp.]|uniref:hypothetical protein n=1 Tax=Arthrobacter sp. TaxID=1667 RepID=UPI0026E050F6|nr:hypothetical protein [Arthrobacter sp.]MDO5753475.1 hypothetical protein [Arthrobacter sp.]
MDALWIAAALLVGVVGGWPVTAGMLALAKSRPVRALDAAESGVSATRAESPTLDISATADLPTLDPEPELDSAPAAVSAADSVVVATPAQAPPLGVLRGGLLIGMLERAAVAVAILSGQPVAIAYVVAIKGLGRYPELKSTPAASERFIIGTLASMLFSASVAVLTKALLL